MHVQYNNWEKRNYRKIKNTRKRKKQKPSIIHTPRGIFVSFFPGLFFLYKHSHNSDHTVLFGFAIFYVSSCHKHSPMSLNIWKNFLNCEEL